MLSSLDPLTLVLLIPGVLYALVFHEVAHGLMARRLGDPTAHEAGRLTLEPWRHLDPLGTLAFLLVGFGWAKPVPINPRYFRRPRRDMALTALAGPAANFLTAAPIALLSGLIMVVPVLNHIPNLNRVFQFAVYLDVALGFFNLIPIPPLDGSRILAALLPYRWAVAYGRLERYGMVILLAVLFLLPYVVGVNPFSAVLGGPVSFFTSLYLGLGQLFWRLFGLVALP